MRRLFRLSLLMVILCLLSFAESFAQNQVYVSGRIAPGQVRVFLKDSTYIINRDLVIGGTLIIEPGTTVLFYPQGRIIDSVGGRIIADGLASATYSANPGGLDPIATPGSPQNPTGYSGYADLNYFFHAGVINRTTTNEPTVNTSKRDYVYNVILNTSTRRLENLRTEDIGLPLGSGRIKVTAEQAMMFIAARLEIDPMNDINLNIRSWRRVGDKPVDITSGRIKFIGQPDNNFSREWGHIVVLPGARAAFFRNVTFEGFRKDTTIDRYPYYSESQPGADWAEINATMKKLTNGSGGALTTFSIRTWLINCEFNNNMARNRGGALQFLQSPEGFPKNVNITQFYPVDKNPNLTERDGSISKIIQNHPIPVIDRIDEPGTFEPVGDFDRQAYDDGRLAVYLGRVRNLKFSGNKVLLTNFGERFIGNPPVRVVMDLTDEPANFPQVTGNFAYGGAIYIAGKDGQPGMDSQIEIGLGVNNSIRLAGGTEIVFPNEDTFEAVGNSANNYQNSGNTLGSRGGAIYLGRYTSLIVAGKFNANETYTKYLQDSLTGTNIGWYSRGGAIYTENTFGRLQVRGGPRRDAINNPTEFTRNKSGAGGAIFNDGNTDPQMSPIIGGSDAVVRTRDYGYNIKFADNQALTYGGAIYSLRNFTINGSGGVEANSIIGYGGKYPVIFENNTAGYAGGAIDIRIPSSSTMPPINQRAVQIVRAEFRKNTVGQGIAEMNKIHIRGGGAIYSLNADLNVVKGVEFAGNKVYNGNGGALAIINPWTATKRYYVSDLDKVDVEPNMLATGFTSVDEVMTYQSDAYPPDARMLTRFLDNEIIVDEDILTSQSGTGTTQIGHGLQGTSAKLIATSFIDQNTGFAVGMNGTIVKITLGGSKWEYKNYNIPYRFNDVTFIGGGVGFIAGDRGIILKTVNNGGDWRVVRDPLDNFSLNSIFFVGTDIGYAVGGRGKIFKTTDGGETWFDPVISTQSLNNLNEVFFTGVNTGYAVGDRGAILVTTNGGANWNIQNANTISDLKSVYFSDASTGYIVGNYGVIFKTTNAGSNWSRIYDDPAVNFNSVVFTTQTTGYATGDYGVLLKTTNGGANWTALTPNTSFSLSDIFFASSAVGYAVGDYGLMIGTRDAGATWKDIIPADISIVDVKRYHPDAMLPENGVGLGGAIYILDSANYVNPGRQDSISFNRVRIQNNKAYTGSAIYSDNYDLKLIFSRSLITGNEAYSDIGYNQNAITGPAKSQNQQIIENKASSDLAGATLYGEIVGPLPSTNYSWAANSIYNNKARFLIRLPDGPNTKGVLAGKGVGLGGTDTLRGNYWGKTEANVTMQVQINKWNSNANTETFFVESHFNPMNETYIPFVFSTNPASLSDATFQGPFESTYRFNYRPIPLKNGANENTVGTESIPEVMLMSGLVYDLYDKGTDIKAADYSNRRMSPIEDFAVGIPPVIRRYTEQEYQDKPSFGKYVRRWLRDPFIAELRDNNGDLVYPEFAQLQDEFRPDKYGNYYHPIGYPLFLEARVNYDGLAERSNHDTRLLNESVFFVINENTGDFIRVNMRQVSENAPFREIFRARVELVPDSSNRNPNTTIRRTIEGLYNLGTGDYLLRNLIHQPYNEDRAALPGRKYHASTASFGRVPNLFSNRHLNNPVPYMAPSNNGTATFFAGERYSALPVDTGDVVRIVSRTVLWKEGVIPAFDDGFSFKIVASTMPPVFTGNVVKLQTDTIVKIQPSEYPWKRSAGIMDTLKITEFLHRIFVTEDREYPVRAGTYSDLTVDEGQGRDSILTVTAIDTNKFFDPRSLYYPDDYARLTYTWYVYSESGLARWLMVDTIPAGDNSVQNPRDGALGYIMFRGRPINPYVVPGGEFVEVSAANYPPHMRTIDSLKALPISKQLPADVIANYIGLFRPYMSNAKYDILENTTRARYLQQDTINYGPNYKINYLFKIFVVDSQPRFLNWVATRQESDEQADTLRRRINRNGDEEVYVVYKPSVYTCGMTQDNEVKANLTDKLRMQLDFNTDDEMEDEWAKNWDFRYGKTAYGFMNIAIRNNDGWTGRGTDTVVIDTTTYDADMDGRNNDMVITQSRPSWMSNNYLYEYDEEDTSKKDPYGIHLTSFGQINVRIDAAEAYQLLKPRNQYNGAYNTDTVFTIVVNDGHGGLNFMPMKVFVNIKPTIITDALPNAKEDIDYNPQLLDSAKMIKIYDPNFHQNHRFELIYEDDPRDFIDKDPCFPEAGQWDIRNLKTTPRWLKINPVSGLLYGTPGIEDALRNEQVTVAVWDLVDGEIQLSDVKTLSLFVDSTNHRPKLLAAPLVKCVDKGRPYSDTLIVSDYDLKRLVKNPGDIIETLTLRVIRPASGFTIEPSTITGKGGGKNDPDSIKIVIKTNSFDAPVDPDGKVTIEVEVTDAAGASYRLIYRLKVSDPVDFICPIVIENTYPIAGNVPGDMKSAYQILEFGTAEGATTGDGLDGEVVGKLDNQFCEWEIPPRPTNDIFDARWTIPQSNGTHRNIFPRARVNAGVTVEDVRIYKGIFQAGAEAGNTSIYYPVSISWNRNDVPAKNDAVRNPRGSQWFIRDAYSNGTVFNYNMRTGEGAPLTGEISIKTEGDRFRIQINRDVIDAFIILHDWASDAPISGLPNETGIISVSPNPFSKYTQVQFGLINNGRVKLDVIDALGNVVAVIADADYEAGQYTVNWNAVDRAGNDLPNGAYTCRMTIGTTTSIYKMVIVK